VVVVLKGGGILTGGVFGSWPKRSHWGSVSTNRARVALDSDWRDVVEEGYAGVEGLGGGERATREGGESSAKSRKPSCWRSVLANETQGLLNFDWVVVDCEAYTAFEGWRHVERAACGRGPGGGGQKKRDSSYYDSICSWIGTAEASCEVTGGPAVVI
jgi:hypothetical protein